MRRTRSTLVRDVGIRQVETIRPDATLVQCAQLMRDNHVGSLVVVEAQGAGVRPIGIVTDRDIVLEAVAPRLDPDTLTAADIMAPALGTVREDADIVDALAHMGEQGARRIPVTTESGELAGIVAMDDVVAVLAEQLNRIVEVCAAEHTREIETRRRR
ncbi:MAG TPA: CBS domain-containing protein [Burkholderiaceae bacterium]|nr:CBS domain-containing protein [Burkholderiaceae bacterium]